MSPIHPSATGSPGLRLRTALLGLLVLVVLGVAPAAASAASMSIAVPSSSTRSNEGFPATASGTADRSSYALLYLVPSTDSCPATPREAQDRNARQANGPDPQVGAGSYSYTGSFVAEPGSYTVCGYLTADFGATPDATAVAGPVRVVGDADGDGIDDESDRCPNEFGSDSRTGQRTSDGCPVRYEPGGGGGPSGPAPGAAPPKEPQWMRFVGRANLLDLFAKGRAVNQLGFVCDTSGDVGCEFEDSKVTIKVSAAVRRKHKLPSRTIARSGTFVKKGEVTAAPVTATAAMVARLKKAKVKKLTTSVTLKAVGTVSGTVTKKQVFYVGRRNTATEYRRFCIGTAKDRLCGPDGDPSNDRD